MSFSLDYKAFSPESSKKEIKNHQWWKLPKEEIPGSLGAVVQTLQMAQTQMDTQRQISARLYGNVPLFGIHGMSYSKLAVNPTIRDRVTFNLVQSCIDTVAAKIAKNKPSPLFLTEKGDYKLRRKAQKLNQFMDGLFYINGMRRLAPLVFRDACVNDTGCLHVFNKYNQVCYERVMNGELLVDEQEAMYGDPRQIHRLKMIDRLVLADAFPSKSKIIMANTEAIDSQMATRPHVSDQVVVCESWRLPSGPEATDGKHVIAIDNGVLNEKTDWEHDFFPFAFFRWSDRMYGFWGQSLAEQLQNLQLELNKALWCKQRSLHLMGSFKILIENGSKIVKEHMNNDIGSIVNYTGTPPQYVTPSATNMDVDNWIEMLVRRGFEQSGISMLSATAQKPAGLDSGKALREYNDIETERFMLVGQAYEQFHLDVAKLSVYVARDIVESEGGYKLAVPGRKFIESIDWKEVDLKDDQFTLQTFPISSLPKDPEGRLATINEYIQAGFIDQRQGRRLLNFPDLDQAEGLANAAEERVLQILDRIVDDGLFTAPDQFMDLELGRRLALEYYNQYANENLEPERLELIVNFMTQIDDLQAKAMPPAPEMAMPPDGTQPLSPGLELPPPAQPPPLM